MHPLERLQPAKNVIFGTYNEYIRFNNISSHI